MISEASEPPRGDSPRTWIPILGSWVTAKDTLRYTPQYDPNDPESQAIGLTICDLTMEDGTAEVVARMANQEGSARIVFRGRETDSYYSAGLGGYGYAFVIDRFHNSRWSAVAATGTKRNLETDHQYELRVIVEGQTITLFVDGIRVLRHVDPNPLEGEGLGLFAWKTSEVTFTGFWAAAKVPEAFVVMEFSPDLDPIYEDVIRPTTEGCRYSCRRADDVKAPGIILTDVFRDIARSTVVIAEISTANPNVFYEIGIAHALGKKTILLAQEGTKLPFDISPHRCIFYPDRIRGSRQLQDELRKHLEAVLARSN